MPVTDLPHSDELASFRRRLEEIVDPRWDAFDEESNSESWSNVGVPTGRTDALARRVGRTDERGQRGGPMILDDVVCGPEEEFLPRPPDSLGELGMRKADIEAIVLKFLLNCGPHVGFEIAKHIRLPLSLLDGLLRSLKEEKLLFLKSTTATGDYLYELTEAGIERARRNWKDCTYFGSVPVSGKDYIASVGAQSVRKQNPKVRELQRALDGLVIRLAQAVNSGLGLFLFGAPGNGKTTISRRLTRAFGEAVWIPRAISIGGSIMRIYDPNNHVPLPLEGQADGRLSGIDERWIRICRPTITVGGELTLDSFEVRTNQATGVNEAPIQLKSNLGTLVIDDFGRQQVTPTEILNRWIIPLAQRYDVLSLRNGRKFEFPVDQLVVFSTNLEPRDLVDEAFLRRIPYKIDVGNPSEDEYRMLLRRYADQWGVKYQDGPVDYLIEKHYRTAQREMRYCHPADILHQVCTYCNVLETPLEITNQAIDAAAENYFTLL